MAATVTVTDPEIDSGPSAVDWLLSRRRGPQTILAAAIVVLSMTLCVFHFYSTYYGQTEVHAHRSTHLAFMVILAFLFFPFGRQHFSDPLEWSFGVDAVCIGIALGALRLNDRQALEFIRDGDEAIINAPRVLTRCSSVKIR